MKKLKVAFDGQLFLKGNKTGIAWCADNIVKELAKNPSNECICDYFNLGHSQKQVNNLSIYEKMGIKLNSCKWFNNVLYKIIWPIVPIPYWWFFGKERDVTIFFNFIVPPGVKGKKIVIVHDMAYKAYPQTVNKKTRRWLELTLEKSCKRADIIITVSQFSKKEIIKYLKISGEKIIVMPNGVDLNLYHSNYSLIDIEECKNRYKIQGDYFLYLGTLEPRKNLERLLQAYKLLVDNKKKEYIPKLVLAGGKGWYYEGIFEAVEKLNLNDNVIFTGYVSDQEAPLLMNGARAFVFPSLYEGFGMPPLEAMACGVPVVVSNTSSLPEVVGEAGIFVDPLDIKSISNGLLKSLEIRNDLKEKGKERSKFYTWEKSIKILYKSIGDRK